ncbi:Integrase catalytic core [Arabidopsis suecica]|uniref:Integrase catalytic core n=1 Tax=Arabidopsis suecica TaxID=45249 RepID=A0A8T2CRA8_ARASU|nr:Integrase catalytic core [Arabidopsis suecica]
MATMENPTEVRKEENYNYSYKRIVLPVTLNGDNYLLWARSAKNNLGSCGLRHHIEAVKGKKDPSEVKKEEEEEDEKELTPEEEKWAQEDQVVLVALQNSLETSILQAYSYCEKAKELWDILKNVYGDVSNLTRVFEVKKALNTLHMEDLDFKKYFGKYRSLLAELEMLRPPTAKPKELAMRREQDHDFGLLLGLSPSLNGLVQHILRGDELPTLDGACSQIQKEIGGLGLFHRGELPTANKGTMQAKEEAPVANKGFYKPNDDRKNLMCEHCKRKGHTKEKCWILHPHLKPSKFKEPRANMVEGSSSGQGEKSQEMGLVPAKPSLSSGDIVMKKADLEGRLRSPLPSHGLQTQYKQRLIENVKPTNGQVATANGDRVKIEGIGQINLFEKKSDAFYMPQFTSNLLSVKKATRDLNCYVKFGPNDVHFQDIESGKLLGKGDTSEDLYVLKAPSIPSVSSASILDQLPLSMNVTLEVLDVRLVSLANIARSDNGGEYTGHAFKDHLARHGIIHQTSCPYTPQQNGVAERKNRHLMEVARSMMFHHNVPKRFWGDAVLSACYLINRIPTKILKDLSPFEVINKTKPSLDHLRVFGCVCFVLVPGDQRNKLEPKSEKCVFLGYSTTQKGYKCFNPSTNRMLVSRDVKFFEEQSYFATKSWDNVKDISTSPSDRAKSLEFILRHLGNPTASPTPSEDTVAANSPQQTPLHDNSQSGHDEVNEENNDQEDTWNGTYDDDGALDHNQEMVDHSATNNQPPPPLRRSTRPRSDPETWKTKRIPLYRSHHVAHPIQQVYSIDVLPAEHKAFLSQIDAQVIPQSYEEAQEDEKWTNAVNDEVGAMEKNHTWDITDLPSNKKCVSSKWVFTIKYQSNGEIERYKARLVARGFTQTYGEDYTDTFAPVAKQHTVKVVLSLATNLDWELWQMDVKNAFLQGDLEEEVYMTPPPGLQDSIPEGKVLRLRKAIYGLKQSPRAWYHKLSTTLKANGFRKSEADHTLFTLQNDKGIVVVLVYVDDIIITGSNKEGIAHLKSSLHSSFDIKDLGALKYFLGIEVYRSEEGLFLSQRKYTLDLLKLTGKLASKPAKTPLEAGYKVPREGEKDDTLYKDPGQYRRLVGKLIYLTYTRPDICFAVNQVSQHMKSPTVYHWSMVEHILRYLKGSPGQGIWMSKNGNTEVVGYCDADWAGDRNDRKSTTGYCTFIGGNLATWKTKKQKVCSMSSAEAEYRAMRKLTEELTWLKALLKDLGVESSRPMIMHCDNQAAIHIATNSVFHERTKCIELDCHKVREKIEEGVTIPCFTRSEDQLADIFTKAASLQVCDHIHHKLGLVDLTRP